jgi:hypothetical protein
VAAPEQRLRPDHVLFIRARQRRAGAPLHHHHEPPVRIESRPSRTSSRVSLALIGATWPCPHLPFAVSGRHRGAASNAAATGCRGQFSFNVTASCDLPGGEHDDSERGPGVVPGPMTPGEGREQVHGGTFAGLTGAGNGSIRSRPGEDPYEQRCQGEMVSRCGILRGQFSRM